MRAPRILAIGALALGALLLLPTSAPAGGPTSVLIVSPDHGTTASLYASDDDYGVLINALGENPEPEAGAPVDANLSPGGRQIRVTWLIHDVAVWRVDRIQLDPDGEPWIYTQHSLGGAVDPAGPGVWHRSPRPDELLDLLDRLGVLGPGSFAGATGTAATPTETAANNAAPLAAGSTGSAWTLPALAAGVVAGVVGDRLLRRRRSQGWELYERSQSGGDHERT